MSHCCHKGFHLILKLPFKLRFKINSVVFPKQSCSQWNDCGAPACTIQLLLVLTYFQTFRSIYTDSWRPGSNTSLGSMRCIQGITNNSRDRRQYFSSPLYSNIRQDLIRRLSVNASVSTEKLYITECVPREPQGLYESHRGPGKEPKSFSLEPSYI